MKKRSLISICVVSVFLLSGLALAGFEPTPFIGQLGAVENILNSADDRISKVMSTEPSPFEPSPALIGAVNRLEAIDSQLMSVDQMIYSVIDEVMGFEPTPFREDIVTALVSVKGVAQGIADNIDATIAPDPNGTAFEKALYSVQESAQLISDNTQAGINLLSSASGCFGLSQSACWDYPGICNWVCDNDDCVTGQCVPEEEPH